MRMDVPIYFQKITPGTLDPTTGNYTKETITETKRDASVNSTTTQTMNLVYSEIRQDSLTARIQNHYNGEFDRIRIGDKQYKVDYMRPLKVKQTFVLSEVQ